jgi:hypothetical protein
MGFGVLSDDLKAILRRNGNGFNHGAVNGIANFLQVRFLLAFKKRNSNQRHQAIMLRDKLNIKPPYRAMQNVTGEEAVETQMM